MAKRVFISYRRDDTAAAAGRVYDRLWRVISKTNVFFDVTTIRGGEDFERRLVTEIARSDAVLVCMGHRWLEPGPGGKPRVFDHDDYVRAELRAALARPILVLPVLVDGAPMPPVDALPEDVREIASRNALPLRHASFDDDAETIVATVLGVEAKQRPWESKARIGISLAYGMAGALLALAGLAAIVLAHFWIRARPLSASIGDAATTFLLIVAPLLGAWLGLRYAARRRSGHG